LSAIAGLSFFLGESLDAKLSPQLKYHLVEHKIIRET